MLRLTFHQFRHLGPACAAALVGVGHEQVVALLEKEHFPAGAAVRRRLPRYTGEAATVPEHQRIPGLGGDEPELLHVELSDFVVAIGVGRRSRKNLAALGTLHGDVRQRHQLAAYVVAAHLAQRDTVRRTVDAHPVARSAARAAAPVRMARPAALIISMSPSFL
jgi:hypothetical protein